jgi:hypothetical protein
MHYSAGKRPASSVLFADITFEIIYYYSSATTTTAFAFFVPFKTARKTSPTVLNPLLTSSVYLSSPLASFGGIVA